MKVSAIVVLCASALVAVSSPASAAASLWQRSPAYTYARHYVKGQVSTYAYTEAETETGQPETILTADARLKSFVHHGIGGEQVKWFALSSDGQDLNAVARAFPPYVLSLDPKYPDGLALPNTQSAGLLQGPIDDLLNFYVSLSVGVGIDNVHKPGQSYLDPTLLSGNFSNATTPVGKDLTQLTTTLTSLNRRRATFTSSYQPPPEGGLQLSQPFMSSPVCGSVPNNFEDVQVEGTEYLALWGCESIEITTVVDRASGQILSAQMSNPLQLDLAVCTDETLTECSAPSPFSIQRAVQLTKNPPGPPR